MMNGTKINPWSDLVSDRDKEMNGVRCDVPNVDGWWFQIARLSPWNAKYFEAQSRLAIASRFKDAFKRVVEDQEAATPEDDLLLHELEVRAFIEGCIRGGHFTDKAGKAADASSNTAVLKLFLAMPALYHWARKEAGMVAHFTPDPETIEKNSVAASAS